jgi:hypothetical protein
MKRVPHTESHEFITYAVLGNCLSTRNTMTKHLLLSYVSECSVAVFPFGGVCPQLLIPLNPLIGIQSEAPHKRIKCGEAVFQH